MPRILIVDDDEPFRLAMRNAFARRGYEVTLAANADEAIAALTKAPDYAVVDLRMPGPSGLEVVRSLRALPNPPQVVVLTGYGTIGTAVEAIRLGAINYLNKPADADEVEAALLGKRPPPPVGDARQITHVQGFLGAFAFSPTEDVLAYEADVGGDELPHLFLTDSKGTAPRDITADYPKGRRTQFLDWARDGKSFVYLSNLRDETLLDLYEYDLASGRSQILWLAS